MIILFLSNITILKKKFMKKKFKLLGVLAIVFVFVVSCEINTSTIDNKGYITEKVSNKVKNVISTNIPTAITNFSDIDLSAKYEVDSIVKWNYDSTRKVTPESSKNSVIMVDAFGYDIKNNINYGLAYYLNPDNENEILLTLIIKTEKISNSVTDITYYDETGAKILIIENDLIKKTNNVLYSGTSSLEARGRRCSGRVTFACIQDAYTANYGWVSVWLWAQSIVIPQTCGVIAIACAYSC